MEFPSSDEEDENYDVEEDLKKEMEEELKENKKSNKVNEKNGKQIQNAIKNSIIKEKIEKTYYEINEEFEKLYTHETNVHEEDFLLQFHKKYPQVEKNYNTKKKLLNHINKYCSLDEDNSPIMNIREYKQKCRSGDNNNNGSSVNGKSSNYNNNSCSKNNCNGNNDSVGEGNLSEAVKNALDAFRENNSVDVEKRYMYAGKIYTVKKKIDKTSSSYKRYIKTKDKMTIGGNFTNIDKLIQNIQENKEINTLDKSTEDWKNYKITHAIDEEKLKAHQNYIENKLFVENVERKLYENKIKNKSTIK
ncbi:conserved Plasmodium protein, unknown function [Plasmodium malariae]|uniref:BCNT-C domain-containing protein n=1 Tax=Plasmodium malariae TaxID=5858 RepID=A0A1C3KB22_PLAMA|nr:conserved Plasmodium protein, unknown function [Plasmodium malariae]